MALLQCAETLDDLALNVLDGAHLPPMGAVDRLPAVSLGAVFCRAAAVGQISQIFFVNILFALVAVVAAGHQLLADRRVHPEIEHPVRRGQPQQPELVVEQPVEERIPLFRRELRALVHRIGGGIPVRDDNAPRFVLPNACETKMVVTMNARSLLNFFRLRCCERAQWEIRALADEMLRLVYPVAPHLFRTAGPGCLEGPCPEGKMCCGRTAQVREKYAQLKAQEAAR